MIVPVALSVLCDALCTLLPPLCPNSAPPSFVYFVCFVVINSPSLPTHTARAP